MYIYWLFACFYVCTCAASFLLQKCYICIVCKQWECFHCPWRAGGWEAVESKAAAVSCGQIGVLSMCSVHSGSMGLFNTSTLYPHGSADRAVELSLSFLSHLSLPLFCLDIQMHFLFPFLHILLYSILNYSFFFLLGKALVRKFSCLNRNNSSWICTFRSQINCLILCGRLRHKEYKGHHQWSSSHFGFKAAIIICLQGSYNYL